MGQVSGQLNTDIQEGNFNNSQIKGDIEERVGNSDGKVVLQRDIAAGAAGADVDGTTEMFYTVPTGKELLVTSASIIAIGTAAGIDASNTCAITVETTDTVAKVVASKTYSDDPAFPAAKVGDALTLGDFKKLAAGDVLTYTITQGTTADHNGFSLIVEGTLRDA